MKYKLVTNETLDRIHYHGRREINTTLRYFFQWTRIQYNSLINNNPFYSSRRHIEIVTVYTQYRG